MGVDLDRQVHINFWYVVAVLALMIFAQAYLDESRRTETIAYSEFRELLEDERLESVSIANETIHGTLKEPDADGHQFVRSVRVDPDFAEQLAAYGVEYEGVRETTWLTTLLSWLLPAVVFVGVSWPSYMP